MKLKDTSFEDVIVGAEKTMDFVIDTDNSLIFEILRDKMYKDKIGSICREVMSNCRDANREAGISDNINVTIIEPNVLMYVGHQSISFKDSGIGISPDRMADIYVKYASSTKRDSNGQTGGFGLGAKTPFAYNDTFTVITVCEVDGIKTKYYYTALIDSSRKGKMILFDTEETDEPTGTEVIVPIKTPTDRQEFERKAFFYTKFWGCVNYNNFSSAPVKLKTYYTSKEFDVTEGSETCLIIDGIPYPLEGGWGLTNISMARNFAVALKFETGDLTISANRESIQYDEETVKALKERSEFVFNTLVSNLDTLMDNFPSYLEACRFKCLLEANSYPPLSEEVTMFDIMVAAIGNERYNSFMLTSQYKNRDFTYEGKALVSSIQFKYHKLEVVRHRNHIYERRGVVYKEQNSLSFFKKNQKNIYYGDRKRDSRRNATIFDESYGDSFLLLTPYSYITDLSLIQEEYDTLVNDFGIEFKSLEAVEPKKYVKKASIYNSSKIPATEHNQYGNDSVDLFYDKNGNNLYSDEDCNYPFDLTKTCFISVDRINARNWVLNDEATIVKQEGWKVILVNHNHFNKKLLKCGVRLFRDVSGTIIKENKLRWIEEGEKFLVQRSVKSVSYNLLSLVDVLPKGILPATVLKYSKEDLDGASEYYKSYNKVSDEIKLNESGLTEKIRKNLKSYPLLFTYVENTNDGIEEQKINITQYVKQIENYGK